MAMELPELLERVAEEISKRQELLRQSGHHNSSEVSAGLVIGALRTIAKECKSEALDAP